LRSKGKSTLKPNDPENELSFFFFRQFFPQEKHGFRGLGTAWWFELGLSLLMVFFSFCSLLLFAE